MKKPGYLLIIILCGIFNTAYGIGYIHYGRLEFHPFVGSRGLYTDNINQVADNQQSAFLSEERAGFGIFWPGDVHLFRLDYGLNLYTFPEIENIDKKLYPKNSANLLLELNFPGGVFSKIDESYLETLSPASGEEAGVIERMQNNAVLGFGFKSGEKYSIGLMYTNVIHDYKLSVYNDLDRMEQGIGPTLYLKIFNKTSLLLDYKFGIITYRYDRDGIRPDSNEHNILLGITGKLTSKLTYEVKAGLESRKYKDSSLDGFSTPIMGISLIAQPSSLWSIDLKFTRRAYESNWGQNYYFMQNKSTLSVNWYPTGKITAGLNGGYEFNQYNKEETNPETGAPEKRKDGVLSSGIDLFYDIQKWLKISAGYSIRNRASNFNIWDYTENRFSFGILLIM